MKTRFQSLQESLRASIWARLERGELTGRSLAERAGFRQAHLSNFLNGKRGLSLQAMDRLLDVLHLDVLQLAGVNDAARRGLRPEPGEPTEPIILVKLAAAAQVRFSPHEVQDTVSFRRSFLRRLKPHMVGNRRDWTRFVVVRVDSEIASGTAPLIRPGAQLLIDRHCNAPPPLGEITPELYAVMDEAKRLITPLTVVPGHLIVCPLNDGASSQRLVTIPSGRKAGDLIIGRVRHIATEM